jgi:hypothetical protein
MGADASGAAAEVDAEGFELAVPAEEGPDAGLALRDALSEALLLVLAPEGADGFELTAAPAEEAPPLATEVGIEADAVAGAAPSRGAVAALRRAR